APQKSPTRLQLLDVIEALVPHVEADSRRTVADLLANMSKPPLDLALRLCRDRASLVTQLLKNISFDEDDIIELIKRTGREHHQILASREDLSANIWIALARAAPSAPPFDHQSTLALWSDDLGILRTGTDGGPASAALQSGISIGGEATITGYGGTATVTPFPSGKQASGKRATGSSSIRIIKTDVDLLAERTRLNGPKNPEDPAPELEGSSSFGFSRGARDFKPATPKAPAGGPSNVTPDAETSAEESLSDAPLKDPGPGGWAWQSDRDGLIIKISPQGTKILGVEMGNSSSTILDLLGLNHKLGHPVARAFQRRSTVHDAPIYLANLEKQHQHWTLEATPFFSSGGGIFDGYQGVLTPVTAQSQDPFLPTEAEATAIFLDDIIHEVRPEKAAAQTHITPQKAGTPTSAAGNMPPKAPAAAPKATPAKNKAKPAEPNAANPLAVAAVSAVKDVLFEAIGPIAASLGKPEPEETNVETHKTNTAPKAPSATTAEILATLDLLDEALNRLNKAGKASGASHVRLQNEIAAACARTLRDQLTN
ncbi:MAG: hypothetical protein JKY34_11160, partial [Kordiimonadaceae bacterium]|nr:hypothetical protein [Kordiimonadaceae bacterium]